MEIGGFFFWICVCLTWYKCLLGEVMISDAFNCFTGVPSFVLIPGVLSKQGCSFACLVRKCLFFRYEDENCYIDDSASDVQNGGIVGRNFMSFNVSFLAYDKPVLSSSTRLNNPARGPRSAVDKGLNKTIFLTSFGLHEWLTLDFGRSFAVESIVVTLRDTFVMHRFSNIKVFLSSELDFGNLFENDKMTLFATHMSPPSSVVVTITPEDGSSSKCGRYLTISKRNAGTENGDARFLGMYHVQPIIVNQADFDVDL